MNNFICGYDYAPNFLIVVGIANIAAPITASDQYTPVDIGLTTTIVIIDAIKNMMVNSTNAFMISLSRNFNG